MSLLTMMTLGSSMFFFAIMSKSTVSILVYVYTLLRIHLEVELFVHKIYLHVYWVISDLSKTIVLISIITSSIGSFHIWNCQTKSFENLD